MFKRAFLCLLLTFAARTYGQTASGAAAGGGAQMQTPPMISGESYSTEVESEERSNYLSGGIDFQTAYNDNVLGFSTGKPVSDVSYSILPYISLNQTTARQRRIFSYSPGFIFYHPTSALNEATQNVTGSYQYRVTPHITVSASESFQKSSNAFSGAESALEQPTTGPAQAEGVIAPFAEMLSNVTSGNVSYQFGRDSMIGGAGAYSRQSYPNPSQSVGLANSDSSTGSAFYNHRLSREQYVGIQYQYARSVAELPIFEQSITQTDTVSAFYSIYFTPAFSISLSAGPQYVNSVQPLLAKSPGSWVPAATAAMGWQGLRTSFTASYSRSEMEVPGLFGAEEATTGNASARWRASRNWSLGCNADYGIQKSTGFLSLVSNQNGHRISGVVSGGRSFGNRFELNIGYDRMHESYAGIATIASAPNSDRVYAAVSYRFTRPLGR